MKGKFSAKQAFWFSVFHYTGVAFGTFSTLFIYPKDKNLFGAIKYIDAYAQIFYPILILGSTTALLNFYPLLNRKLQKKLFNFSLKSILILSAIGLSFLLLSFVLIDYLNASYVLFAFLISVFLAFLELYKKQALFLNQAVYPTFLERLLPKLILPVCFLLIYYQFVSVNSGLIVYVSGFGLLLFLVYIFVSRIKIDAEKSASEIQNSLKLFEVISKKKYYAYSLYAFCASIGSFFAFRVDTLMISEITENYALNGSYAIGSNLANALMIPATAVFALYNPIISHYIKNNKWQLLKEKYLSVAQNLFFIGILLYGCVLIGLNDLFSLLPNSENLLDSKMVIYILGASVLLNMSTGFSTEVIAYSKYYRFNLISILCLAISNISLNYFILTQTTYSIAGIAFASFISLSIFNGLKLFFIYRKFKMIPFSGEYLKMIFVCIAILMIFIFAPNFKNHLLNLIVKCGTYGLLLVVLCYLLNWIPIFTQTINQKINILLRRK